MSDHDCDTGHFDRTTCPEPCGRMHSFCSTCGERQDECAHEPNPADVVTLTDEEREALWQSLSVRRDFVDEDGNDDYVFEVAHMSNVVPAVERILARRLRAHDAAVRDEVLAEVEERLSTLRPDAALPSPVSYRVAQRDATNLVRSLRADRVAGGGGE